jgi:hypothetical protein
MRNIPPKILSTNKTSRRYNPKYKYWGYIPVKKLIYYKTHFLPKAIHAEYLSAAFGVVKSGGT